jgi:hypothetical protein
MEGSLVAYKVFTNGSVLQASEINDNLMRQSVMVFSNAAARTAAITVPLEGMLTYLEDVNRYESYNGTSWLSPFGTALLASQSFTSVTSVIIDNVFNSDFDSYQININYASCATGAVIQFNLRSGGVNASSNYNDQTLQTAGATSVLTQVGAGVAHIGRVASAGGTLMATIGNPARALQTFGTSMTYDGDDILRNVGFRHTLTNGYDGFRILTPSASGLITVYGMRK